MARVFAWLRPNDLIWNYWVNNYLLGNQPPAFDILFWNADTTPACGFPPTCSASSRAAYVNAGKMEVLGQPIDIRQVDVDAYIVAAHRPHHAVEGLLRRASMAGRANSSWPMPATCRAC
jgi:polyhydroxyalkanoate synthase